MSAIQFIQITPTELAQLIKSEMKSDFDNIYTRLNSSPKQEKDFITRKEASELLGITLVCLHDWTKRGLVKHYKLGGRTYFRTAEITESILKSNGQ